MVNQQCVLSKEDERASRCGQDHNSGKQYYAMAALFHKSDTVGILTEYGAQ